MSYQYAEYLHDHRTNFGRALDWMKEHEIIPYELEFAPASEHDLSKNSTEEYKPYDDYFYGNKSRRVVEAFKYAWLHHIHNNPHHWQYWVLQNDDEPEEILEMPEKYVYEMIADWWSFSWKSKNLYEIFVWYDDHKGMKLHPNTRKLVEDTLQKIREILNQETEELKED